MHVHDIFLPHDYPARWTAYGRRQYTEQWLLAAFLHGNAGWEIIWPTNYMNREHAELLFGARPPKALDDHKGGSFWFRRKAADGGASSPVN